jgi:phosphoglycolate phosphatase-like HAD superfamily hydrolase
MFGALGVLHPAQGLLLDLDGVLTQTAKQPAADWKVMFNEFGYVVGVGQAETLREHGADVVVGDLAELRE